MARCDQEINCGLYGKLIEIGATQVGDPCGKPEPLNCPRYQFANGRDVDLAKRLLRVDDVLGSSKALTREETKLMCPQGAETYFEGGEF